MESQQKEQMWWRIIFCSNRYEDEINKRAAAENEFVLLKKVQILYLSLKLLKLKCRSGIGF